MVCSFPVKPVTSRDDTLAKAHRHWLDTCHIKEDLSTPWIPVGQLGGLIVVGHHRRTDDVWPETIAQTVQLTEEDYAGLWEHWRLHFHSFGPNGVIPPTRLHTPKSVGDCVEWFLSHCKALMTSDTVLLMEEILQKGPANVDELPKGWREHALRLVHDEPVVDIVRVDVPMDILDMVPQQLRYKLRVVPFSFDGKRLWCAAETRQITIEDQILAAVRSKGVQEVLTVCAPATDIDLFRSLNSAKTSFQRAQSGRQASAEVSVRDASKTLRIDSIKYEDFTPDKQSVSIEEVVCWMLMTAYRNGASDIHFEIANGSGRIRIRIDGVLYTAHDMAIPRMEAIINVAKSMCGMSDSPHDCQDRSFGFYVDSDYINVRASAIPMRPGLGKQKLVFRLLPKATNFNKLDNLKLDPWELRILRRAMERPNGMILVSGPTGSGKTTTLYALLAEVSKPDVSIQTIEDPVEREIEGINQTAVGIKVSFADALRASLRQDPDIIMIGEIRDEESAALAIQASLTGHLVLSTVHANSAAENVSRLSNLKVDRNLMADAVLLLMAQRLIRRLCPICKEEIPIDDEIMAYFRHHKLNEELAKAGRIFAKKGSHKGKTCEACMGHGYLGRIALLEMIPITDEIRQMIANGSSAVALRQKADDLGFSTLHRAGLKKVVGGHTTLAEAKVWEAAWPTEMLLQHFHS